MNTIAIGMPLVESMSSRFFESWLETKIPFEVPKKVVIGGMIPGAYDMIARWFLEETDCDVLLTMEQDHRFPANVLERVANYEEPIIGAHYYTRYPPFRSVASVPHPEDWNTPGVWAGNWSNIRPTPIWPSLDRQWRREGTLNRVLWVGLGCTAIRRDVFEDWPKNEPYFMDDWDPDQARHRSCDVRFCNIAAKLGFPTHLDAGMVLPHMTVQEITAETYESDLRQKATKLGISA